MADEAKAWEHIIRVSEPRLDFAQRRSSSSTCRTPSRTVSAVSGRASSATASLPRASTRSAASSRP